LASLPRVDPLAVPGTWATAAIGVCLLALSIISRRR
jgi:hypothetical protein